METVYVRINWQNQPSTATALGAKNLNKIDLALSIVDGRVVSLDTTKLDKSTANGLVQDISVDNNGVFTIKKLDGTTTKYDTKLEKIAVNFSYDKTTQQIVITLDDGTKQYIDLSSLITEYEFSDSSTIGFTVTNGKVSASVKNGSIKESHLQPNYLADIKVQAQNAQNSANASADSASTSKRYAVGIDATTEKDSAKYFMEQAKQYRDEAKDISNIGIASGSAIGLVKGNGNVEVQTDGAMWADAYKDKGTSTGEFINFAKSDNALAQVNIKGKSTQARTEKGKNLLPSTTNSATTLNGIKFTPNADGTITLNGTATTDFNYNIFPDEGISRVTLQAGTYTLKKTGHSGARINVRKLKGTDAYRADTTDTTFTIADTFPIAACYITITSGAVFSNNKIEPQLESGSTSTSYEKYSVNSPSPEYPSPIVSASNFDVVSCKKNLINVPEGVIVKANSEYKANGCGKRDFTVTISQTLKEIGVTNNAQHQIMFYGKSGNLIRKQYVSTLVFSSVGETKQGSQAFVLDEDAYEIRVDIGAYYGANSPTLITNFVQLELGTTATPYTPYEEDRINNPYELGEWNDIKDGSYVKGAEEFTYDGSEDEGWNLIVASNGYKRFVTLKSNIFIETNGELLCNKAKNTTWDEMQNGVVKNAIAQYQKYIGVNFEVCQSMDISQFKTWLASNPITVRYKLATPIITPLNTYLKTFNGTTNIFTTANPQPEITATFKSQLWADSYLKEKAIESKIDANKRVNNLLATDPETVLAGPMGKLLQENIDALNNKTIVHRGTINNRLEMTKIGTYDSNASVTADMPTADQPYKLLFLGTKGTDWNIPILAFGSYSNKDVYRSRMFTSNGTTYQCSSWEKVGDIKVLDTRGTQKKPSEYPIQSVTHELKIYSDIGLSGLTNQALFLVTTKRPWTDLTGSIVQVAEGVDPAYGYESFVRRSTSSDTWTEWQRNDSNTVTPMTINSPYGSIESGGYIKSGRIVTVNIRVKITTEMPGFQGHIGFVPLASTDLVPLTAMRVDGASISGFYVGGSNIACSANVPVGAYIISGSYVSAS
ncbi:hypothetical protein [Clostridium sp. Marseille-P299]|uniref:hypothetical protein n=1 Tax=Clostridium sp. Marseille-P299 TaxID=1805477 RepID=UPI0011DE3EAB|nr:hypothetical protein [Clostridium sp. Marseille-P299]